MNVLKNILILTVDCWNLNIAANSSYTYSNLFSDMKEYSISNIYIREEMPNDPCCKRYFQISESKIIKSLLKRNIKTGREVFCEDAVSEEDFKNVESQKLMYDKHRKKFYYTKKIIRELIWFFASWKSKELDDYLESVKPDVIIFSMEGYIHFNRICRYVLKKTGAKSIGYFWDDNFTYKQRPGNVGYKFLRFFQRKSLKKLSDLTTAFWAISPKTKKEADDFFGIDCRVLPKSSERAVEMSDETTILQKGINKPLKMLYAGNLMIGRLDTIRMVSEFLADINKDELKLKLDVYTPTQVPPDLKNIGNGVEFHLPVSQSEVLKLQQETNILLFAEDVIGKERKVARLSFSTKIPDYLSCGRCILAVGDYDTAPMEYFREENIALCACNKQELTEQINNLLLNPEIMYEYGERARKCAAQNHSKAEIQRIIRKTIEEVI